MVRFNFLKDMIQLAYDNEFIIITALEYDPVYNCIDIVSFDNNCIIFQIEHIPTGKCYGRMLSLEKFLYMVEGFTDLEKTLTNALVRIKNLTNLRMADQLTEHRYHELVYKITLNQTEGMEIDD